MADGGWSQVDAEVAGRSEPRRNAVAPRHRAEVGQGDVGVTRR